MSLQCTVISREGRRVEKRTEVGGEGKSYLAGLSEGLRRMQGEVNSVLTEMVEAERGGKVARNGAGREEGSEGEGMAVVWEQCENRRVSEVGLKNAELAFIAPGSTILCY